MALKSGNTKLIIYVQVSDDQEVQTIFFVALGPTRANKKWSKGSGRLMLHTSRKNP
jgi:hypothetical protein